MTTSKEKRATDILLDELHGLLSDSMVAKLREHKKAGTAPDASFMAQVIKFLKDNGIDAPFTAGGRIDNLRKEMPTFDPDTDADHTAH